MRRRGIVMDLTVDAAVVFSTDGEFCRLPRSADMTVGSEVSWESHDVIPNGEARVRRFGFSGVWYRIGIAGVAACLAIAAGAVVVERPVEAYARVSIDINPSVAVTVNSHIVVTDVTGIDADGQRLVSKLKLKGESLKRAVTDVLAAAAEDGMIPDADTILISAALVRSNSTVDEAVEKIALQAEQDVKVAIHSNPQVQKHHPKVYALGLSNMIWNAANQANISPGKLAAYLIAITEGKSISLGQLQGEKLGSILSSSKSKSAMQVLNTNNATQVEQWLNQLLVSTPSAFTSNSDPSQEHSPSQEVSNNQPTTGIGPEHKNSAGKTDGDYNDSSSHSLNSPGKYEGSWKGNQTSESAGETQNSVTVHLGNSVINVPLGNVGSHTGGVSSHAYEQASGLKNDTNDNQYANSAGLWNVGR